MRGLTCGIPMRRGKTKKPELCPECGEERHEGVCPRCEEREREYQEEEANRQAEYDLYCGHYEEELSGDALPERRQ